MKRMLLALGLSLLMMSASAAEFYRWIDEEGNLQLTQTPPPPNAQEVIAEELPSGKKKAAPAPAKPEAAATEEAVVEAENAEAETEEEALTAAERLAQQKQANCKLAKDNIDSLNSGKALGLPDPDNPGNFKPVSEEQRQQALEQAQAYLETYCTDAEE